VWESAIEAIPSGQRYQLLEEGQRLSFRTYFSLLEHNAAFAKWYTDLIAGVSLEAFFWEHPPVSRATLDQPMEFVIVESTALAKLPPDPEPFAEQFAREPGASVVTFANLGGDALLVAPAPIASRGAYPHLAAFLRKAPRDQILAIWQAAGRATRETLGDEPRWLSTAGLGVSWLHLRLDTWPKYYRHKPYKTASSQREVRLAGSGGGG
jgi:hypothetical protein